MIELVLRPWQSWLLEEIKRVNNVRDENLSLSDYDLNKLSQIKIKLPKGAGHTFLTAYLSLIYNSVIVHRDVEHWNEIASYRSKLISDFNIPAQEKSTIISVFELFYATHYALMVQKPSDLLTTTEALKNRIINQSIVVVDRASSIPNLVEDFILNVAHGPLVFLD